MTGEFDGLILIGMPLSAGGSGVLAGFIFGLLYPFSRSKSFAVLTGCAVPGCYLIALFYTNGHAMDREDHFQAIVFVMIMFVGLWCGVQSGSKVLGVAHGLARASQDAGNECNTNGRRVFVAIIAAVCLSLLCDLALVVRVLIAPATAPTLLLVLATVLATIAAILTIFGAVSSVPRRVANLMLSSTILIAYATALFVWFLGSL